MPSKTRRLFMYLLLTLGGGVVFQSGANAGCVRLNATAALGAVKGCFIFDCQNGILGGLIDPCADGRELFRDCPPP